MQLGEGSPPATVYEEASVGLIGGLGVAQPFMLSGSAVAGLRGRGMPL